MEMTAKITKVKEDLFAVEFAWLRGDYFMFIEMVKSAREYFGGHVNAPL